MKVISDDEITDLIHERKPECDPAELVPTKAERGHLRSDREVTGAAGSNFRVMVRQAQRDPLDFSVILGWDVPGTSRRFRLMRCNGNSHRHINEIEGDSLGGFHVHLATQRYQERGFDEDGYAEPTDAYTDLTGALQHLLVRAAFESPAQGTLL